MKTHTMGCVQENVVYCACVDGTEREIGFTNIEDTCTLSGLL